MAVNLNFWEKTQIHVFICQQKKQGKHKKKRILCFDVHYNWDLILHVFIFQELFEEKMQLYKQFSYYFSSKIVPKGQNRL